ncbi:MAG TPA: hypothetical protein VGM62_08280 [Chthoniobacterales bacterium]
MEMRTLSSLMDGFLAPPRDGYVRETSTLPRSGERAGDGHPQSLALRRRHDDYRQLAGTVRREMEFTMKRLRTADYAVQV